MGSSLSTPKHFPRRNASARPLYIHGSFNTVTQTGNSLDVHQPSLFQPCVVSETFSHLAKQIKFSKEMDQIESICLGPDTDLLFECVRVSLE